MHFGKPRLCKNDVCILWKQHRWLLGKLCQLHVKFFFLHNLVYCGLDFQSDLFDINSNPFPFFECPFRFPWCFKIGVCWCQKDQSSSNWWQGPKSSQITLHHIFFLFLSCASFPQNKWIICTSCVKMCWFIAEGWFHLTTGLCKSNLATVKLVDY